MQRVLRDREAFSTSADQPSGSTINVQRKEVAELQLRRLYPAISQLQPSFDRFEPIPGQTKTTSQMAQSNKSGRSFPQIQQDLSMGLLGLKKPAEFLINIVYNISALAPLRVCIEVGIFEYLTRASTSTNGAVSANELSKTLPWTSNAGIDPEAAAPLRRDFIVRMLRQISALGVIDEGEESFTYRANDITREMADPKMAAGILLVFDALMDGSTMGSFLAYAQANSFCPPPSGIDGPYQHARGITGTSTFDHWVQKKPEQLSRLSAFMNRVQKDRAHWTEWFPSEVLFPPSRKASPERMFLVDVGGGLGHDVAAIAEKYKDPELRFQLQDLSSVIDEAKTEHAKSEQGLDPRISLSTHDFFSPQPVEGAEIYFIHEIMHDWPDADCVRILSRLRDAMADDSSIFVNEVIVPARGASLRAAGSDITMLCLHSGQERDEEMWRKLIASVGGLKIESFHQPPGGEGEGIIKIVRAP